MVEQDSQADVADDDFVDKRRGWLHGRNKLVQYVRLMHNFIPKKVRIAGRTTSAVWFRGSSAIGVSYRRVMGAQALLFGCMP